MKKFFYMAVAAIAALSSCSSDNDIIKEDTVKQPLKFTATMEGSATRATLSAKKAQWEVNDQININGKAYKATTASTTTTLEATGEEATLVGGKYKAYFPASMYDGTTVTLPASYTYADDKFDMPMYAESTTTELSFKNLCAVLAITVPSTQMSSVTSIVVSSDKRMNGEVSSISDAGVLTFASSTPTDAEKKVTLTVSPAVSIPTDGSKTFYVPVPANTHNPLTITISNGTVTKAMITKAGGVTVARSYIYSVNFEDNRAPWENALLLGKGTATSIVIETGVTIPTVESDTQKKLNAKGNLWEVLEGQTLRIRTSAPKIIGHNSFGTNGLFINYSKVESITGLENVDFSEVTDMNSMFNGCKELTSLDLSNVNTSKVEDMNKMFLQCLKLSNLNLSGSFNTSKVTNMSAMFGQCEMLTGLNLSNFNTSEVTNMASMFVLCSKLENLDLSNFNTSKVTLMNNLFYGCSALKSINLTSFNTSEVTTMNSMFYNCNALTSLDLSNFNTSKVTNMYFMFNGCTELTSLNLLGSFNTSKVTDMTQMFDSCKKLTSLDLSNFNTSEVTSISMYLMFHSCEKLASLTLSNNFVMTNVSNKANMFQDCGKFAPGGKCTVYGAAASEKYALSNGTYWVNMKFDGE